LPGDKPDICFILMNLTATSSGVSSGITSYSLQASGELTQAPLLEERGTGGEAELKNFS
jgi:hypothetical protein